jgi:uncharacterized membrane protein
VEQELGLVTKERHPRLLALIVVAVIVAVVVRWYGLAAQSLWWDEGYTVWFSQFSLNDIWRGVRTDTAPPLYYWLMHFWTWPFGISERSLPGMSAFFETLSIPLSYLVAKRVVQDKIAVLTAVWLFALCAFEVEYARDARFYAVIVFCSISSLYCLITFLDKRSVLSFAGLVVALAAGLYTHNMIFFYLPGLALAWLFYPSSQSLVRRVQDELRCAALLLLLYLPWFPGLVSQTKHVAASFWIPKPTLWGLAETLCSLSGLDSNYLYRMCSPLLFISHLQHRKVFVLGGILLLVSCAVAGIWKVTPERCRKGAALLGHSLCPVLLAFFYSRAFTSVFLGRTFIASSAVLSILFAFSVAYQTGLRKKLLWGSSPSPC